MAASTSFDNNKEGTFLVKVDLIKLFGVNLLTVFCNLDHFINVSNIYGIAMKRPSLQNIVSKFMPNFIYEIEYQT
jgi:hypothetical protein